jgi:hypothetical protein
MSSPFENISKKTDELVDKQRRSIDNNKAQLKAKANSILGIKAGKSSKKSKPKSKVERGMEVMCALIAIGIALIVLNVNAWPFSLLNGGEIEIGFFQKLLLFFGIGISMFLLGMAIVRPIIKRLEAKYGKQAW